MLLELPLMGAAAWNNGKHSRMIGIVLVSQENAALLK